MLQVRNDLCLGCGICAQGCPRGAISLLWGQAEIDQSRCNSCGLCLDLCPQGAIVKVVPVSREELKDTISNLKHQADDLLVRIDRLRR
jgi:Fe-S-cluster-containing hydrogenase component 2